MGDENLYSYKNDGIESSQQEVLISGLSYEASSSDIKKNDCKGNNLAEAEDLINDNIVETGSTNYVEGFQYEQSYSDISPSIQDMISSKEKSSLSCDTNLKKMSKNANSDEISRNVAISEIKPVEVINEGAIRSSSSFLSDNKSDGSLKLSTSPNGSCLRSTSRTKSSNCPHVQFETLNTDNEQTLGNGYYVGDLDEAGTREVTGYWIKAHPERGTDYEGGLICGNRKKKRSRNVSGSSNTSMSSTNSVVSETSELHRKAPDGGWGWVVVFASFFVNCIADGVTMSFGVLFIELLNEFEESKSFTSLVGSLFMAIPLLAGPIASLLTDHYGCRTVTIIGAIIAFFGFFLSAFANSIYFLLITLGLITGLGLALCYVAAIVIVAFYFEKKRSLATGIAVAGSGIGTFVYAPFMQYLINSYGWRGCLIILSGIFLNMCVCGALMRDLEWTKKRSDKCSQSTLPISRPNSSSQSVESLSEAHGGSLNATYPTVNELKAILQSGDVGALFSPDEPPITKYSRSNSTWTLPTFISRKQSLPPDILPCLNTRGNAFEIVSQMYPHLINASFSEQIDLLPMLSDTRLHRIRTDNKNTEIKVTDNSEQVPACDEEKQESQVKKILHPVKETKQEIETKEVTFSSKECSESEKQDNPQKESLKVSSSKASLKLPQSIRKRLSSTNLLYPNFLANRALASSNSASVLPPYSAAPLRNLRMNKQSMTYRGAMLHINRYRLRASSCPDIYRNSMITIDKVDEKSWNGWHEELKSSCHSCMDMPFCQDPGFLVFCLSNFILYFFYDTVYMYLVDYAQENGVDEESSASLISIIGFLNCVGMVGMGYIGDKNWSPLMLIYNISMVVCGITVIIMPFVTNYRMLQLLSATFGFFISANYALTSVILVELISLDRFTKAYGILLLIQGMANLLGPPLVGFMRDTTENYVVPFVVSGVCIIFCGLILFSIPFLSSAKHSSEDGSCSCSSEENDSLFRHFSPDSANPTNLIKIAAKQ